MINIEKNQVRMTLSNGWVVSIVNHGLAYCDNPDAEGATNTAEVWAWHSVTGEEFGVVRGHLSPNEVTDYIAEVAALPPVTDTKVWRVEATEPTGGPYGSSMSYTVGTYWIEEEARAVAAQLTVNEQWSKEPTGVLYSIYSMIVKGERPF